MNRSKSGIHAYKQANVVTADPRKLVIMCYEGAISNLTMACDAYRSGHFERKCTALVKAQDIIMLLIQSLDLKRGGQIAQNLDSLYNYILRRITEGDIKQDTAPLEEASKILNTLLTSWKQASPVPGEAGTRKPTILENDTSDKPAMLKTIGV